ncbi:xanthine dehydrogenase family protein molybdopterin-binding subunit [Caballeronia sp. LZ025]|uniref:xanthine dehydrogenase family protein molybdopterin-binding subunit n=1 Tax=Caballeronia TaxID=1827195 RepID=UPI001FD39ECB|nr:MULTISPECIES: xanthine dehydrogenase family protein molybdopterin-binding subunit [Caballeronia]MDR5735979.1 xanthine dehydrogenase family protein molybdopterin-binding subunit [Caballeronia sp. LZ025]
MSDIDRLAKHQPAFGVPHVRIDGEAKFTGRACYASDEPVQDAVHAFLLTSSIARGRVRRIHAEDAFAIDGVLDVLTHENVGSEAKPPEQQAGGATTTTLESDRVWHDGQIIGVIVATSYEIAREAAQRTRIEYDEEPPSATFGSVGAEGERREPGEHEDYRVGDFDAAFAAADCRVEAIYATPTQHHNPIELYTTTCAWRDGTLTTWEPSQFVYGLRGNVAQQLGIEREKVHVISRFVGGAFGGKGNATARTAWIAIAARRVGRPVKLVATRDQSYTVATYRAETRHHIQLGATRDGKLVALRHEGWELTSRPSMYNVSGTETTARMYACPNIETVVNVVHADRNTPGFMRAPPETPYMFALETAFDELAVQLSIDPVELRRRNDTAVDPVTGKPFTSRRLVACLDAGAQRFGWAARNPQPGSMTEGDWLIGWGCASAAYPSNIAASAARVTLRADGRARVDIAAHDIGTGAYTVIALTAAQCLGIEPSHVDVRVGDTDYPPASLAAGSSHTATITHAVACACDALRDRLACAAALTGPLMGRDPQAMKLASGRLAANDVWEPLRDAVVRTGGDTVSAEAEHIPQGLAPEAMDKLRAGKLPIVRGHQREDATAYAFGAHFVEVRVHRLTREIRVPRMVGAFASGTIVNPLTAHSQYMAGMIWGVGAALLEETEIDVRHARYVNDNISEYLIPTNADVDQVDVIMLPDADAQVNPLGVKGLGEIGIVGMNAAISNAVYHATGRRVRELPIRIDDLV